MTRNITVWLLAALFTFGCWGSSTGLNGTTDTSEDTSVPDGSADTLDDTSVTDTPGDPVDPPYSYALHEWGVFVFESWSEGATVHGPSPEVVETSVDKPVIYIHTDEEFDLDVSVGFLSGEASEVWPVTDLGPHVSWNDVHVSPGGCDPTPFPSIWDEPWVYEYCEACTLGTCVVEDAACLTHDEQVAELLFYAGSLPGMRSVLVGSYELIETGPGESPVVRFDVVNDSVETVEGIWLTYRTTTSVCEYYEYCPVATADLAVGYIDTLSAGAGHTMDLSIVHLEAELDEYGIPIPGTLGSYDEWDELPDEISVALQEQGLYASEAEAFIAAWHVAMFGLMGPDVYYYEPMYRNGASMLYFMSRAQYDEQLPIELSPPPAEMVRVGMVYQHI